MYDPGGGASCCTPYGMVTQLFRGMAAGNREVGFSTCSSSASDHLGGTLLEQFSSCDRRAHFNIY